MSEWKDCTIADLVAINRATYSPKEGWPFINYLDTGSVTENNIEQIQHLDVKTDKVPSRARRKVVPGSIVYSTVRPNQRHYALIKSVPENFLVSTGFAVLDVKPGVADERFVFSYLTQQTVIDKLQSIAEQGVCTYPALNPDDIGALTVRIPDLPIQRKIAAVLGALDDKIELNRKMNANLETMAQTLFKSWFVDFEPFGGKMPEGWRMGKLNELIVVCYGKDHKKLSDGEYPVYGSGGIMRYAERPIFESESVLIPRKGTLNNIMYVDRPFWTVDTMFYSKMVRPNVAKYVYLFLSRKDMESLNAGSAVPSMTTEILNDMDVVIPSDDCLENFEDVVSALFQKKFASEDQNRTLAQLRDALLPKLMSGELDVDDVKID